MPLPYYPFYWGDYSKKTMHLSQGQHGAYVLFLRFIYTTGRPIPHDSRYGVAQAFTKAERENADFVLNSFFVPGDGYWHNPKAEEVISKAEAAHEGRVRAGRAGGSAKASNARAKPERNSSNATARPQHCSSNYRTSTSQEEESLCRDDDPFAAAWGSRA